MKPLFEYNIDVVSRCNLACPSCPQGNTKARLERATMSIELLDEILVKAHTETRVVGVHLYNWTEPLLHPQLPLLIDIVHAHGDLVYLSANLNHAGRLLDVLNKEPHSIRISCSGFRQSVYEQTHTRGDIDTVKENMRFIADNKSERTSVHMLWHKYRHNVDDGPLMEQFCLMLGFKFIPIEAYYMPLETVLDVWDSKQPFPALDSLLHTSLYTHAGLCSNRSSEPCRLQTRQIAIDAAGFVMLCCAVYDPKKFTLGRYLDMSLNEIQKMRFSHNYCDSCIKKGGHVYAMGDTYKKPSKLKNTLLSVSKLLPIKPLIKLKEKLGI